MVVRKCSELYFRGDWIYSNVMSRKDGSYEVKIVTKDLVECVFVFAYREGGRVEVISDEEVK
ncbi:MAG: hypothetical protein QXZ22_08175 [Sulfolobales archaeon]